MEGTSIGVSKTAIKVITEENKLFRQEFCDEYSPLGISELISEGVKGVDLFGLIEITIIVFTNSSELGEYIGCKEDVSMAVFHYLV